MPGIFSNVFEDRDSRADGGHTVQRVDDGDQGSESHGSDTDTNAEAHANPTIVVHDDVGASWDNPDGSETTWSNSQDVTLTVDLNAAAGATTQYDESQFDG